MEVAPRPQAGATCQHKESSAETTTASAQPVGSAGTPQWAADCCLSHARNCWNSAAFAASVKLPSPADFVLERNVLNRPWSSAETLLGAACSDSQSCAGLKRVQPGTSALRFTSRH